MSEAARQDQVVVDMREHLRSGLAKADMAIAEILKTRTEMAITLAAADAASDPEVLAAAEDYERRTAENRPYENARSAEDVISEAARRYGS